jgi:SLT domain-containing protein
LFAGGGVDHGLGDTSVQLQARADGLRRVTRDRTLPARSANSANTLRRLAHTDGTVDAILATARADRARASAATRLNVDAAVADPIPAADTPLGRRQAMARMAARLRAQHGHVVRSRARARLLASRLRRQRYPLTLPARHGHRGPKRDAVLAAIRKALDIKGIRDPAARARWERGMELVARRESNYDADAVNNWDSNAARGTPSKGAWQFVAPTFAAYHEPGTSTSIRDLVAQACAFINYAQRHYHVAADASNLADRIQQADPRRAPRGY